MNYRLRSIFLPLALSLVCAAPTAALAEPPLQPEVLERPPTMPPSQALLDRTHAMAEACRAWLPLEPIGTRNARGSVLPSTVQTNAQFDLCEMALHPEQAHRLMLGLTMAAVWGGLVTILAVFYLMYKLARTLGDRFRGARRERKRKTDFFAG
ncbi:hypothetical protein J2D73_10870 [Acetobacter sacchari]|uniref:Uncharacterized protein n=1 Tax=Acetobacter sacchari TaxID=2661687 RepID=A0ABS3LWJ6_9PROT|nr:hypothetical protein [Acetobacter sacchari]MBO1360289.1 hypothetical protein [Acetobacter sacchari]